MGISSFKLNIKGQYYSGPEMTINFALEWEGESPCMLPLFAVGGGMVAWEFKAHSMVHSESDKSINIFGRYNILNRDLLDHCNIRTIYKYNKDLVTDQLFHSEWNWNCIATTAKYTHFHEFTIRIEELCFTTPITLLCSPLYDDTTFTDFELCGEDGSIIAHKAILAAASPVLKTMLSGQWKETSKGKVDMSEISVDTLTDLKTFIYKNELPIKKVTPTFTEDTLTYSRLESLLKLAHYLNMRGLIQACSAKLLLELRSGNALKMMALSNTYKLKGLMNGIIMSLKFGILQGADFSKDWN